MDGERASCKEGESGAAAVAPAQAPAAATGLSAAAQRNQAVEEAEKKETEQLAPAD